MKKVLIFLIALGLLNSVSFCAFSKDLKIAYVDLIKVLNDYEKTEDYDGELQKKTEAAKKKLEAEKEKIQKMQKKLSLLKDSEQEKQREKIEDAIRELQREEKRIYVDLKKEQGEMMKEIGKDIQTAIDEYAKKNDFDIILNQNDLLYAAKAMDVTDTILDIVNKKYK